MRDDGVDVDILESVVKKEFDKLSTNPALNNGRFWAMFYTIPTFHNPTGILMSSEKSKRVIQIARKYDLVRLDLAHVKSKIYSDRKKV